MKVKITKPVRVNAVSGEVEIDEVEYQRLRILDACQPISIREIPEKMNIETRERKRKKEV